MSFIDVRHFAVNHFQHSIFAQHFPLNYVRNDQLSQLLAQIWIANNLVGVFSDDILQNYTDFVDIFLDRFLHFLNVSDDNAIERLLGNEQVAVHAVCVANCGGDFLAKIVLVNVREKNVECFVAKAKKLDES